MTLVRVRGHGEITLPRELQEVLAIREGDTLEGRGGRGRRRPGAASSKPRNRVRYGYEAREVEAFVARVEHLAVATVAKIAAIEPVCRDPDDDHLLAAALAAGADCFVAVDADLLSLGSYGDIRIVSVRAFLRDF